MNISKIRDAIFDKHRDVIPISSAYAHISSNVILLDLVGIFKMITINYYGEIKKNAILQKGLKFYKSNSTNKIIIRNPNKLQLINNILIEDHSIVSIRSMKIIGWRGEVLTPYVDNESKKTLIKHSEGNVNSEEYVFRSD